MTFTKRDLIQFAGMPALDFTGNVDGATVQGLEILSGTRVYLFVAAWEPGSSADFAHFRDSFQIV